MRPASLRGIGLATCVVIGGAVAAGCTALLGAYEVTTEVGSEGGADSGADGPITLPDGAVVCGNPTVACGAICVDTANDPKNCGGCGAACASGPCAAGNCTDLKCDGSKTKCGNVCTDLKTDNDHCGSCPKRCIASHRCVGGDCTAVCNAPEVACSLPGGASKCVNTATDDAHCGGCGRACPNVQSCAAGVCQPRPIVRFSLDTDGSNSGTLGAAYGLKVQSGTIAAGGKFGRALIAGYGTVVGARQLFTSSPKITVSFWMRFTQTPFLYFFDNWENLGPPYGGVQLGWQGASLSACVATKDNKDLSGTGSCDTFPAPNPLLNAWHNYVIRYDGTAVGSGGGGPTTFFVDGVLALNRTNDAANNAVFNVSAKDTLTLGHPTGDLDEVRIYDRTFDPGGQCTVVIGATWDGTTCKLP